MEQDSLQHEISMLTGTIERLQSGAVWQPGSTELLDEALEELEVCREEFAAVEAERRADRLRAKTLLDGAVWSGAVLNPLPVPALVLDRNGLVRHANPAAGTLVGAEPSRLVGKPLAVHVGLSHRFQFRRIWQEVTAGGIDPRGLDVELRHRDGSVSRQRLVLVPDPVGGRVRCLVLPGPPQPRGGVGPAALAVASLLADLSALALVSSDTDDLVARAVAAVAGLPGVAAGSVSRPGRTAEPAVTASSSVAHRVEAIQRDCGQGPGLLASSGTDPVISENLARDARWPVFGPRALQAGVGSVTAVPMAWADGHAWVLSLWGYPGEDDLRPPLEPSLGRVLAATLGTALQVQRRLDALRSADQF
jgi:PAS domain S-box-containing protein